MTRALTSAEAALYAKISDIVFSERTNVVKAGQLMSLVVESTKPAPKHIADLMNTDTVVLRYYQGRRRVAKESFTDSSFAAYVAWLSKFVERDPDPEVAGRPYRDRLMQQVALEGRRIDEPIPTAGQVAMVLHALADHTAIMAALEHRPDPTSPWPAATSIGRWFHDVGNSLEDLEGGDQ